MLKSNYKKCLVDHILFVKRYRLRVSTLIVYVDGVFLIYNDVEEVKRLKKYLHSELKIKDLGELRYFLVIEFAR